MIKALRNEDDRVRAEAAKSLGNIKDAPSADQIIQALKEALTDEASQVRASAKDALWFIGDTRSVDHPVQTLKDERGQILECFKDGTWRRSGDGFCSDESCPCSEVRIPRGEGYIYISKELVEFRRIHRTPENARAEIQRTIERIHVETGMEGFNMLYRIGPILMCEHGAILRNLDLTVAAADAKHWWATGEVPLRATPTIQTKSAADYRSLFRG